MQVFHSFLGNLKLFVSTGQSRAVGIVFALNGFVFGNWVTRIPDVKSNLLLSESDIGIALFGIPAGSLLLLPFMGKITNSFGAGKATFYLALFMCFSIYTPTLAFNLGSLFFALMVFGVFHGSIDIAMNTAAAIIEKEQKRVIMSTCHACWSFGAMFGAAVGAWTHANMSLNIHLTLLVLFTCVILIFNHQSLVSIKGQASSEPIFALPGKNILLLAFIGFCVFLTEGSVADWSALFMEKSLSAPDNMEGLAYAAFALMMALGRLTGDLFIMKFGGKRILFLGALLTGLSLISVTLVDQPLLAIGCFALAGLGISCGVPVVFSQAAKLPGMVTGASLASVASLGYLGFLIGPPTLGFIAEKIGYTYLILLIAGIALLPAMLISIDKR